MNQCGLVGADEQKLSEFLIHFLRASKYCKTESNSYFQYQWSPLFQVNVEERQQFGQMALHTIPAAV